MPKRDMDLVRTILLELEKRPFHTAYTRLEIEGYDDETLLYHVMIMAQAGLIEARKASDTNWQVQWLTWEGQDFLDAARDESRWQKATAVITQVGGLTFDVLKSTLSGLGTEAVKALLMSG
jgi:hypothetical protein